MLIANWLRLSLIADERKEKRAREKCKEIMHNVCDRNMFDFRFVKPQKRVSLFDQNA